MKHSIDDIRRALEFYVTKGVHGNRLVLQKEVPAARYGSTFYIPGQPTWIETVEFSLTELKLYNSKLGRAMYVS